MFSALKRKLEEKKRRGRAVAESQHWKHDPLLQGCLQTMRGSCTVVPIDLHEALTAVVNIALQENTWIPAEQIPVEFLTRTVYLLWNDARLPALMADRCLLMENLDHVTAVAPDTFLINETMDRVVHLALGKLRLYDLTGES